MASPTASRGRRQAQRSPAGPAALARVLRLHASLVEQRPCSSRRLAGELGVTERTIKRDIAYMRDQLGCPIEWDHSAQTYRYTHACDLLPLLRLTADEALSLTLAGQTFAAWAGSPLGQALTVALAKIAGVVGGTVSLPASAVSGLVQSGVGTATDDAERKHLALLLESIHRRRVLRVLYQKPTSLRAESRRLHPLHLALLDHEWVLIAHDVGRRGLRNFRLSRIRSLQHTGERFDPPADFDAARYLRGSVGRFTGEEDWRVHLEFDAVAAPYVRERPWHPSQQVEEQPEGGIHVSLTLNNLIDVQRRVLACGRHARVLAPRELRKSVAAEVAALADIYLLELAAAEPATPEEKFS